MLSKNVLFCTKKKKSNVCQASDCAVILDTSVFRRRCTKWVFLKILQKPQKKQFGWGFFFKKVAGLKARTLLKCFAVNFVTFLRRPLL